MAYFAVLLGGMILVFAGSWYYWPFIVGLSGGAGAYLGALIGAFGGLSAIMLGALYNANPNRERDDRLRAEERDALIAALQAEAELISSAIRARILTARELVEMLGGAPEEMNRIYKDLDLALGFPAHPVYDANIGRLGLLGAQLASDLAHCYSALDHTETTRRLAMEDPTDDTIAKLTERFEAARETADQMSKELAAAKR